MATVGYVSSTQENDQFSAANTPISVAESRAVTAGANGATLTEVHSFHRVNTGSGNHIYYVYETDVNGTPTNQISGPHTDDNGGAGYGIGDNFGERGVTGLSVSISANTSFTVVTYCTANGRYSTSGSTDTSSQYNTTPPTDPWTESTTTTNDWAIWGVYTDNAGGGGSASKLTLLGVG